jgi:nucleoside-diphosphate-sugar epimerase
MINKGIRSEGMRVLVTGAAGFVGSHLCERLIAEGHDVVGLDGIVLESYAAPYKHDNLRNVVDSPQFTMHKLDLRTDDLSPAFDGVEAVIHLAAIPGLPISWERLDLYTTCNLLATGRLLHAAQAAKINRFVHVSTSSVYGQMAVGDEQQQLRPFSPYGLTKLAAENLLFAHHDNYGFPVLVLRYFSIYGPRQRPDMAYHIFMEALLAGRPITVFGDGSQSRSNTYVDDCVDATVRALTRGTIGQAYNVGGGELITLTDAIAIISELAEREPIIDRRAERPGDQKMTQADTTKARNELGYEPKVGVREGLERQFAWHLDRRARLA